MKGVGGCLLQCFCGMTHTQPQWVEQEGQGMGMCEPPVLWEETELPPPWLPCLQSVPVPRSPVAQSSLRNAQAATETERRGRRDRDSQTMI